MRKLFSQTAVKGFVFMAPIFWITVAICVVILLPFALVRKTLGWARVALMIAPRSFA
jgi:hypothetical protein